MCYFGPMTGSSERRTAAIVAADVVGYFRMMGRDETATLEGLAEPGGILISHTVYDGVAGKLEVEFADCGKRVFKNITESVHVWSWPRQIESDYRPR